MNFSGNRKIIQQQAKQKRNKINFIAKTVFSNWENAKVDTKLK